MAQTNNVIALSDRKVETDSAEDVSKADIKEMLKVLERFPELYRQSQDTYDKIDDIHTKVRDMVQYAATGIAPADSDDSSDIALIAIEKEAIVSEEQHKKNIEELKRIENIKSDENEDLIIILEE